MLGINDYFGWYPGPGGQIADPSLLPDYLAQERACYPKQAMMVTEFGAEANRDGPIDERGTYEFQTQFATSQLNALDGDAVAQRRDLVGARRTSRCAPAGPAGTPTRCRRSSARACSTSRASRSPRSRPCSSSSASTTQIG